MYVEATCSEGRTGLYPLGGYIQIYTRWKYTLKYPSVVFRLVLRASPEVAMGHSPFVHLNNKHPKASCPSARWAPWGHANMAKVWLEEVLAFSGDFPGWHRCRAPYPLSEWEMECFTCSQSCASGQPSCGLLGLLAVHSDMLWEQGLQTPGIEYG